VRGTDTRCLLLLRVMRARQSERPIAAALASTIESAAVSELRQHAVAIPPNLQFVDAEAASRNLAHIAQLVPADVLQSLMPLLASSANPDAAVNQFERLAETGSAELFRLLQQHPSLIHYALVVFAHSVWLGETLIHNKDLFYSFVRDRRLDHTHSREEFEEAFARMRSRSFDPDTAALLARFKRREYVRIMLRDVLGIATLAETTAEISALSDVLIEEALREAAAEIQHRFGTAQHLDTSGRVVDSRFSVLSLGKLGGNELNYSSDIDLMFLYDGGEEPAGTEISNREYFIRLAQQVTEVLSRHTSEGPVFRIDLRLRPQGNEGEPAVPLSHAVHYYSRVAHDWELQAMIKARHSAGDVGLAREFVRAVQPYVYRSELNFVAIKTALETREKIGSHRRKSLLKQVSQSGIDVKIDRGGIRDIEFLVQCLQRVYGGTESWLRSRGTLFALQKLHDKEHLGGKDFHNLTNAYEFLRNVEHRLQLQRGQQLHRLPQSRAELQSLSRSVAREGTTAANADEFVAHVQRRMSAVQEIYQRIIYREQSQDYNAREFQLSPDSGATAESTYSQMLQRLAIDSPRLRELAQRSDISQHSRRNLDRFLSSAGTSSERYGAILRSPEGVERALEIFEYSDFLTEILVRYPEELSVIGPITHKPASEGERLFSEDRAPLTPADPVLKYLSREKLDRDEGMSLLRRQYRRSVFLAGALDIFHCRSVFESFADYTAAADLAIEAALAMAGPEKPLAVMALGRLGTREFDVLSDADLLLVCDDGQQDSVRRTAETFMQMLTAYTRDGAVFSVDTRLRPHGREGELIVSPSTLKAYFAADAKPWEALTYLKLRHVAGDSELAARAFQVVRDGVVAMAARVDFDSELADMRRRLERSESPDNLKTAPGGSYDLDYICGVLQCRRGLWMAEDIVRRLEMLQRERLLSEEDFRVLEESARFLRTVEHVVRLVSGRTRKWLPVAEHPRRVVQKLLWRMLQAEDSFDPELRLAELMRQARQVYAKYLDADPKPQ